jgi:NAD(P)H-flavin reductase
MVLLYGVREEKDILMKEQLDSWHELCSQEHRPRFRRIYCIGSRWSNIHIGAKTNDYVRPCLENKLLGLGPEAEVGWINEEKIRKWGFPPSPETRVFVCGLPGVYDKLCGPRLSSEVTKGSVLDILGYSDSTVVKF